MRGVKFISVNNFSAQEHASSRNSNILNFRVMEVQDIQLCNVSVEKYILISGFLAFLEVKVLGKCLSKCLLNQFTEKVAQMAKVSSRCLYYFPAAMLVSLGGTPTWWLHTGLCKFVQNISTNISRSGKRTDLKLGEVS